MILNDLLPQRHAVHAIVVVAGVEQNLTAEALEAHLLQ